MRLLLFIPGDPEKQNYFSFLVSGAVDKLQASTSMHNVTTIKACEGGQMGYLSSSTKIALFWHGVKLKLKKKSNFKYKVCHRVLLCENPLLNAQLHLQFQILWF